MFNIAFSIGGVGLTWNAIMLALGILVAVVVTGILGKKRGAYKDLALDLCIIGILAGLVGARLFAALSGKIAFASFFRLYESGLNLPGALLFCGIGFAVYARIKHFSVRETFDLLLPGAFFGLAVGRWSDFFLCEGLGPVVGANVPKFFPLVTFTAQYFRDGTTVAYAVFFLDFLVCLALGAAAIPMTKKLPKGRSTGILVIVYLFAEFILEWLRDGATRQLVFGDVRFNQIVWLAMLIFFAAIVLLKKEREAVPADAGKPSEEREEGVPEPAKTTGQEASTESETPSEQPDVPEETPAEEAPDVPEETPAEEAPAASEETPAEEASDADGGDGDGE